MTGRWARASLVSVLALLLPAPLGAQQFKATVNGTVSDGQGGVLPGVAVRLVNVDTTVSAETVTDSKGVYTLEDLIPGRYRLTAAMQGFKSYVREGIVLETAETATVNIVLTLGALEETVTVTAGLSEAESNSSVLSQAMENQRISELPLDGGQVYQLLQLTSGTLFLQEQFGATGSSGTRAWDVGQGAQFSIHGSRTGNNEFLIDGAPNSGTGTFSYSPPVEAIQEFKVDSASTSAQYSRTSGGIVSVTLKSGTNQLRGSATTLVRGTVLDANTIQNLKHNISNQDHEYINGEGTVSGPIVRGRTFIMGGYQGFYENIPFPKSATVPTDVQRLGDFSQLLNSNGQRVTIYDPLTTSCNAAGQCTRQAFPDNRIPLNRINPVALALLNDIPRANVPGTLTGANDYFASPNVGFYRYNSYLTRIDHNVSDRHRLSFSNSANWGYERRDENGLPPPAIQSGSWPMHRNHYLATVDDTITLSDRAVINTRVSFDRFHSTSAGLFGLLNRDLGFTTPYQATPAPNYPKISISGDTNMFPNGPSADINNIASVQSVVSKTAGRHLLKAGAEFRMYQLIRSNVGNNMGIFTFNSNFTQRDPNAGASNTQGNGFASFLLGLPDSASVDINHGSHQRYDNYGVFFQDDWQISPRATLNLGLRWDHQSPVAEANNAQVVGFDPTATNPIQLPQGTINTATNQPFGTLKGGILFAGVNGNPSKPYNGDWKNFQPRVSFAYKVTNRLTARANYGRSYLGMTACCAGVIQNGFNQTTSIDTYNPQPGLPFRYLDSPFPAGILQPTGSSLGLATGVGQSVSFRNPDFRVPFTDQWMAGLSVDLPWHIGVNVAYVGNRVRDLPMNQDLNLIPITEQEKAIARLGGNNNYLNTQFPSPFFGLVPQAVPLGREQVSRGQLLKPYPQFSGVTENFVNLGYANYKALEMSATKRMTRGWVMSVNYTWSRRTEATSRLNAWDTQPFNDISGTDRPRRIAITGLYTLPFGPNQRFGRNARGLLAQLIGGWQYNVIGEIQSGAPIGLNGRSVPLTDHFALPDQDQSLSQWFDTSTAARPRADGTYAWGQNLSGTDFRVAPFFMKDVRGPAHPNWGMSVFKGFSMAGGKRLQLRAEMFNVFNMRSYGGPQTDPSNSQFGQIGGGQPDQMNFPRRIQIGARFTF